MHQLKFQTQLFLSYLALAIIILFFICTSAFGMGDPEEMETVLLENIASSVAHVDMEVGRLTPEGLFLERLAEEEVRQRDEEPAFSLRELPPLVGAVAGIPLSQLAVLKAGDSTLLKIYFAGSTITSVGLVRVWALDALFMEVWKIGGRSAMSHAFVNVLSVLSTLPLTYVVWKNTKSIWLTGISFMSEWSLSTLGFYQLASVNKDDQQPGNSYALIEPDVDHYDAARKFYRHLMRSENPEEMAKTVLNDLRSGQRESTDIQFEDVSYPRVKNVVGKVFAVAPLASWVVNSFLAYKGIKDFTTSPLLVVPYVLLTTVPTFALQWYTTSSTVDDLWGDTVNARRYHMVAGKKGFYLTAAISLACAVGSSMWGLEVVEQTFRSTFLEKAIPFFMATTMAQLIIFESHSFRDYIAKKFFHYREIKGSTEAKELTSLVSLVKSVSDESSPSNNYSWYNPVGWCVKGYNYVASRCWR